MVGDERTDGSEDLRDALERCAMDEDAHAARQQYCRTTSGALARVGQPLWAGGAILQDDRAKGLGTLVQMAGELSQAAVAALDGSHGYACAALVRQLVEVEYLAWAFSDDPDDAARWLRSSPSQLDRHFKPSEMRKRAGDRFNHCEYRTHCALGGHPNPRGAHMLSDHSAQIAGNRWLWIDLGQHLERAWAYVLRALEAQNWTSVVPIKVPDQVEDARRQWHDRDMLAIRLPRSFFPVGDDGEPQSP